MTQAEDENRNGVKQMPAKLRPLDAAELDALGGEPLAGSGFEEENRNRALAKQRLAARPLIKVKGKRPAFSTRAAWVAGAAVGAASAAAGPYGRFVFGSPALLQSKQIVRCGGCVMRGPENLVLIVLAGR